MNAKQLQEVVAARRLAASGAARSIRLAAGLSLAELAAVVGVTPGAVARWEHGDRVPRSLNAMRYGRALQALMARQR